LPPAQISN
jgi:hypothetical protein